ncbi:MAG: C39 family peptidase [Patescibacteria group bacterium]
MPSYRVPFSSQYTDLGHHEWRARGCGITALKMVMDYWHGLNAVHRTATLEEVLAQGLRNGAYLPGVGWSHKGLVEVARHFGYTGFNVDYAPNGPTPKSLSEAWDLLVKEIESGPILVSVFAGLDPYRKGGHIVVLTGAHDGLVFLNDPEEMSEREGRKALALKAFLPAFKRRYIVIQPRSLMDLR